MSGAGIEELYKNYGVLADAGENVAQVSQSMIPYIRCLVHEIVSLQHVHHTPPLELTRYYTSIHSYKHVL